MTLTLHLHPLSSYCWKALIALYEHDTPFRANPVNLGDPAERAALKALWPVGKFPVLVDAARDQTVPESSILIEYLDRWYPGPSPLIPRDADAALGVRLWDRFYDLYVHAPLQRIVADRLRPEPARDPHGVAEARALLQSSYDQLEARLAGRGASDTAGPWACGETFTLADCAAAPALFYAHVVEPLGEARPHTRAYLERLIARPSFARVLDEARPWFRYFPFADALEPRFLEQA